MVAIIGILLYLVAVGAAVGRVGGQPRERAVMEPESAGTPSTGAAVRNNGRAEPTGEPRGSNAVQNPSRHTDSVRRSGSVTVPLYRGHSAGYWNWRYRQTSRELRRAQARTRGLRRTLLSRPSVTEAINLAGATYGFTETLWRKARCESGLNPSAKNGSEASGLLQFLPSTWATTPYARFSIWSPYANAMAAGWMHAHGRGGEWSCR